jgi:hypothetical protein
MNLISTVLCSKYSVVLIIHKSNAGSEFGHEHQLREWFAAIARPGQPRWEHARP